MPPHKMMSHGVVVKFEAGLSSSLISFFVVARALCAGCSTLKVMDEGRVNYSLTMA